MRRQITLAREKEKSDQHRDRGLPVQVSGYSKASEQGRGSEDVHHVIHIEAIARPLLRTLTRQGPVHTVAEPVQDDAQNDEQQRRGITPGEGVCHTGCQLRGESKQRQLVGTDPARHALRHPLKRAFLHLRRQGLVEARRGPERGLICLRNLHSWLRHTSPRRSALQTAFSVNPIDSRGILSTYGSTTQPSPRGIERLSERFSICNQMPPSPSA